MMRNLPATLALATLAFVAGAALVHGQTDEVGEPGPKVSGMNADYLDGQDSSEFWAKAAGSVVDASETAEVREPGEGEMILTRSREWTSLPLASHEFSTDGGPVLLHFGATCGVRGESGSGWANWRMTVDGDSVAYASFHVDVDSLWETGQVTMDRLVDLPAGNHTVDIDWRLDPRDGRGDYAQCMLGHDEVVPGTLSLQAIELKG